MKCPACNSVNDMTTEVVPKYRYEACGLVNVVLENVTVQRCSCGENMVELPQIAALHREIASAIAMLALRDGSVLTPTEIAFLETWLEGERIDTDPSLRRQDMHFRFSPFDGRKWYRGVR